MKIIKKDSSTLIRKGSVLKSALAVALILLISVLSVSINSRVVQATAIDDKVNAALAKSGSNSNLLARTHLYLLSKCFDQNKPTGSISASDLTSFKFFSDSAQLDTGYVYAPDNGKTKCNEIARLALASLNDTLGISQAELRGYLYEDKSGAGNYTYRFISGGSPFPMSSAMLQHIVGQNTGISISGAFAKCYKESDTGTITVDGVKFADSADKPSGKAKVMLGITADGSNDYSCETIANLMEQNNYYDKMKSLNIKTSDLRNHQFAYYVILAAQEGRSEAVEDAKSKINALIAGHPNTLKICVASVPGLPADKIVPGTIANWLSSGDITMLNWQTGAMSSASATQEQADQLEACLLKSDLIGEQLKQILKDLGVEQEKIDAIIGSQLGGPDETNLTADDECLSSDEFIGWLACPIINKISGIADEFQETIQDMLKFSLSDQTQNQQTIQPTWNIFRSLATTLLIVGFLLALLVKTIRGE